MDDKALAKMIAYLRQQSDLAELHRLAEKYGYTVSTDA